MERSSTNRPDGLVRPCSARLLVSSVRNYGPYSAEHSGGGNIGLLVAKMFYGAFEGTILLYDPYIRSLDAWNSVIPSTHVHLVTDIDDLLGRSDIVTVHVPLTPATENMIGAKQFKTMKSSAILINTARGGIVDEQALADALSNEEIFAAGLDAFVSEPPTLSQYPELCQSDRVLLLWVAFYTSRDCVD
jgi:phosphoglycerate dehydrogenase-like enzyme